MYRIEWRPKAVRQFRRLPTIARQRIAEAVDQLVTPGQARNVRPLRNHDAGFRLRVGNYRVLFDIHHTVRIVMIEEVRKRDERTY